MSSTKLDKIDHAILKWIANNSVNPSLQIQSEFSISSQAVTKRLQKLQHANLIEGSGRGRGRRYNLVKAHDTAPATPDTQPLGTWQISLPELATMGEDRFYREHIAPMLQNANPNAQKILEHIATELINNVIDHSMGKSMHVCATRAGISVIIAIKDDGIGVFDSITKGLQQEHLWEAVTELMKGKRTTDPSKHAGEGLFFSMRLADFFQIDANQISLYYDSQKEDWKFWENNSSTGEGSEITVTLNLSTSRQISDVFAAYADENLNFVKKRPFLVKPYVIVPGRSMVSRSEAKRLIATAEGMKSIIIDFKDVDSIGQAFADEIFRVWATQNPLTEIGIKNAAKIVAFMITRLQLPPNVIFLQQNR